jgi:hypothetical protein
VHAQAIFSLLEKTHPPGLQNLSSRIFFYYSTLLVPKETIYIKNWILIAVFRNWEQFQICSVLFYTPCITIRRECDLPCSRRLSKVVFCICSLCFGFLLSIRTNSDLHMLYFHCKTHVSEHVNNRSDYAKWVYFLARWPGIKRSYRFGATGF